MKSGGLEPRFLLPHDNLVGIDWVHALGGVDFGLGERTDAYENFDVL